SFRAEVAVGVESELLGQSAAGHKPAIWNCPAVAGPMTQLSARIPGQDPEKGLNIGIGADIAVGVEVGRPAPWATVPRQAPEERLDIRIRPYVAVSVEV